MLKTKGGMEKLADLLAFQGGSDMIVTLDDSQIKLIEQSQILDTIEKVEILCVSMGCKLTCEVFGKIDYRYDVDTQQEVVEQSSIDEIEKLLGRLPLKFYIDTVTKLNRKNNLLRTYKWFQVSINDKVDYFMRNYSEILTPIEQGVLYGYPPTAILAYNGLITRQERVKRNSIEKRFVGAGVSSVDYSDVEEAYYKQVWERIKRVSPEVVRQAEEKYQKS